MGGIDGMFVRSALQAQRALQPQRPLALGRPARPHTGAALLLLVLLGQGAPLLVSPHSAHTMAAGLPLRPVQSLPYWLHISSLPAPDDGYGGRQGAHSWGVAAAAGQQWVCAGAGGASQQRIQHDCGGASSSRGRAVIVGQCCRRLQQQFQGDLQ